MIEIGLCTDENYAMPCGICITSILENNKNIPVRIHILTEKLSSGSIQKFRKTASLYNQQIEIHIIDFSIFNHYPTTSQFQKSIYFRFLFPAILPNSINKLLYIDCDTIINNELLTLWNTDLKNYYCGVIEDQGSDDIRIHNRIDLHENYFNSGILLINLDLWRKNMISEQCMQYIQKNPEKCIYPDQDALNVILQKKIYWLHFKYNLQENLFWRKELLFLRKEKWSEIEEAKIKPTIIHFCGFIKPWHKDCKHPLTQIFIYYKKISLWKDIKLTYKQSLKRRIINKINKDKSKFECQSI